MCRKREPRDDSYQSGNSSKLILFITGMTGPFGREYHWVVAGAEIKFAQSGGFAGSYACFKEV